LAGARWGVGALVGGPHLARAYYWLVNAGFATVAGLLFSGYTFGRRQLAVSHLEVPVRGLPSTLDGLRLVHLSDLHIGAHLDLAELGEHVERVNALAPDLICVTGDLVDRPETCAEAFPTLAGPRRRGSGPPSCSPATRTAASSRSPGPGAAPATSPSSSAPSTAASTATAMRPCT